MPLWHCPHCGTPQPEAARCWVCRKSSTSCVACRHFRRGVAPSLGYCGLDRRHMPLRGDEIRSCWAGTAGGATRPLGIGARSSGGAAAWGASATDAEPSSSGAPATSIDLPTASHAPLAWREVGASRPSPAGSVDATRAPTESDAVPSGEVSGWTLVQGFWPDPDG